MLSRRKLAAVIAVVGAVLAIAIAAILLGNRSGLSRDIDRRLAALRAAGVPVTAAEVAARFPDPDPAHDARVIYAPAFSIATQHGKSSQTLPIIGRAPLPERNAPIPGDMMRDLGEYLAYSDSLLPAMPLNLTNAWFSESWSNGIANLKPISFVEIRKLVQTLSLKILYEAGQSNAEATGEALRKEITFINTLNDTTLVSAMIRCACLSLFCDCLEQALNRTRLDDDTLLALAARVQPGLADGFENVYVGERHMGINALDPIRGVYREHGVTRLKHSASRVAAWFKGDRRPYYRDSDYVLFLDAYDALAASGRMTPMQQLAEFRRIGENYSTNSVSVMGEAVMPSWSKAARSAVETHARLDCLRTAIAVERYRHAHRQLPERLDELVPAYLASKPVDYIDGSPLRYRKRGSGYVIYSIGADGVDNQGKERHSSTNNYDVTVTVDYPQ